MSAVDSAAVSPEAAFSRNVDPNEGEKLWALHSLMEQTKRGSGTPTKSTPSTEGATTPQRGDGGVATAALSASPIQLQRSPAQSPNQQHGPGTVQQIQLHNQPPVQAVQQPAQTGASAQGQHVVMSIMGYLPDGRPVLVPSQPMPSGPQLATPTANAQSPYVVQNAHQVQQPQGVTGGIYTMSSGAATPVQRTVATPTNQNGQQQQQQQARSLAQMLSGPVRDAPQVGGPTGQPPSTPSAAVASTPTVRIGTPKVTVGTPSAGQPVSTPMSVQVGVRPAPQTPTVVVGRLPAQSPHTSRPGSTASTPLASPQVRVGTVLNAKDIASMPLSRPPAAEQEAASNSSHATSGVQSPAGRPQLAAVAPDEQQHAALRAAFRGESGGTTPLAASPSNLATGANPPTPTVRIGMPDVSTPTNSVWPPAVVRVGAAPMPTVRVGIPPPKPQAETTGDPAAERDAWAARANPQAPSLSALNISKKPSNE